MGLSYNTALLLIDIQNDYFDGGKNPLEGSLQTVIKTKQILKFFRKKKLPVFFIQHISKNKDAAFFAPGTKGIEIHSSIAPRPSEHVIVKHHPNSFHKTKLLELMDSKDIKNIIVCGMMTHMCVDSTVRAAKDYGFNCYVIEDAVASKALEYNGQILSAKHVNLSFLSALNSTYAEIHSAGQMLALLDSDN